VTRGRYREAPILAVSPRPHLALGSEARAHLARLGVTYAVEPLNDTGNPYGTINRIVAGAWAETFSPRPYLVLLDTDTVLVGEPSFARADVGVRLGPGCERVCGCSRSPMRSRA